jgi:methionyl-tRNA formyltransferase
MATRGLKIVSFNVRPAFGYGMVAAWAQRHGHTIALLVTTPGPPTRRSDSYREVVAMAPPEQEIVITTRPRRLVPLLTALKPDLLIAASFPYRIPPEVADIPRLGAVNFHPGPLPRYRGPNPARQLYDGETHFTGSLHRIVPEFDAGPVLAQVARPFPEDVTLPAIGGLLFELITATLEAGLAAAIRGEPGTPQDETQATYAGPFTEEECWLDWGLTRTTLQRRTVALNFDGPITRAMIDGQSHTIEQVTPLRDQPTQSSPGTVLGRGDGTFTLAVGDGVVLVNAVPQPSS